jgi:hypothetical protein
MKIKLIIILLVLATQLNFAQDIYSGVDLTNGFYYIISDAANIKKEPSENSDILEYCSLGTQIKIIKKTAVTYTENDFTDYWYLISYNDIEGYLWGGSIANIGYTADLNSDNLEELIMLKNYEYSFEVPASISEEDFNLILLKLSPVEKQTLNFTYYFSRSNTYEIYEGQLSSSELREVRDIFNKIEYEAAENIIYTTYKYLLIISRGKHILLSYEVTSGRYNYSLSLHNIANTNFIGLRYKEYSLLGMDDIENLYTFFDNIFLDVLEITHCHSFETYNLSAEVYYPEHINGESDHLILIYESNNIDHHQIIYQKLFWDGNKFIEIENKDITE